MFMMRGGSSASGDGQGDGDGDEGKGNRHDSTANVRGTKGKERAKDEDTRESAEDGRQIRLDRAGIVTRDFAAGGQQRTGVSTQTGGTIRHRDQVFAEPSQSPAQSSPQIWLPRQHCGRSSMSASSANSPTGEAWELLEPLRSPPSALWGFPELALESASPSPTSAAPESARSTSIDARLGLPSGPSRPRVGLPVAPSAPDQQIPQSGSHVSSSAQAQSESPSTTTTPDASTLTSDRYVPHTGTRTDTTPRRGSRLLAGLSVVMEPLRPESRWGFTRRLLPECMVEGTSQSSSSGTGRPAAAEEIEEAGEGQSGILDSDLDDYIPLRRYDGGSNIYLAVGRRSLVEGTQSAHGRTSRLPQGRVWFANDSLAGARFRQPEGSGASASSSNRPPGHQEGSNVAEASADDGYDSEATTLVGSTAPSRLSSGEDTSTAVTEASPSPEPSIEDCWASVHEGCGAQSPTSTSRGQHSMLDEQITRTQPHHSAQGEKQKQSSISCQPGPSIWKGKVAQRRRTAEAAERPTAVLTRKGMISLEPQRHPTEPGSAAQPLQPSRPPSPPRPHASPVRTPQQDIEHPSRPRRPVQFIVGPDASSPSEDDVDEGYEEAAAQALETERRQQLQRGNAAALRTLPSASSSGQTSRAEQSSRPPRMTNGDHTPLAMSRAFQSAQTDGAPPEVDLAEAVTARLHSANEHNDVTPSIAGREPSSAPSQPSNTPQGRAYEHVLARGWMRERRDRPAAIYGRRFAPQTNSRSSSSENESEGQHDQFGRQTNGRLSSGSSASELEGERRGGT